MIKDVTSDFFNWRGKGRAKAQGSVAQTKVQTTQGVCNAPRVRRVHATRQLATGVGVHSTHQLADTLRARIPMSMDTNEHGSQGAWIPRSIDPNEHGSQGAWTPKSMDPNEHRPQGAWLPRSMDPKEHLAPSFAQDPIDTPCRYRYALSMPGHGYSNRLRGLLACGCVVIHVMPPWEEYFTPLLASEVLFLSKTSPTLLNPTQP